MHHLFNCHNEWLFAIGALGLVPFIRQLAQAKLRLLKDLIFPSACNKDEDQHGN